MARRYSKEDQQKKETDDVQKLRDKGVDIVQFTPLHPGGREEAMKEMLREINFTAEQSQASTEHNRDTMREREQDSQEYNRMRREERDRYRD